MSEPVDKKQGFETNFNATVPTFLHYDGIRFFTLNWYGNFAL
jgi:hypothetical protein